MGKKVTFTLSADIVGEATSAILLGEFNNWDATNGITLKKQKDGSLKATATLESGRSYQYRYLLNDGRWVNDERADNYVPANGFPAENCVITVTEETETKAEISAKPKKEKKATAKAEKTATVPDNLTKIEGIGKKIAELLAAENILSFKDLSKVSAKKLKGILEAGGSKFKVHDPASWPKQATLAAADKWSELEELQKELTGGK